MKYNQYSHKPCGEWQSKTTDNVRYEIELTGLYQDDTLVHTPSIRQDHLVCSTGKVFIRLPSVFRSAVVCVSEGIKEIMELRSKIR